MRHAVTCAILAGGASSRMGQDKALLPFRGRTILDHQLTVLRPLFSRIVVVANHGGAYGQRGVPSVPDRLGQQCALTGIHAGIGAGRTEHTFVVACDLPFLNPALIERLLGLRYGYDVVIPHSDTGPEPLHAVYSRGCLAPIEACASRGAWKATSFHPAVRVHSVRVTEDGGRSPFTNLNTPAEWSTAGS